MVQEYREPPFTHERHVNQWKQRGLTIPDPEAAIRVLSNINDYRLSAYAKPFEQVPDVFMEGATFDHMVRLYELDEELRFAVSRAISPIEIFLRTRIAYELSHSHGPFFHRRFDLFRKEFPRSEWTGSLEEEIQRAKEAFIENYKAKYSGFPNLPIWMATEVMSFGSLSKLFTGLLPGLQRSVGSCFQVAMEVLRSWIHHLVYIRNICAHHGRLWNREFAIRPKLPHKSPEWKRRVGHDNRFFRSTLAVIEWMSRRAALPLAPVERIAAVARQIVVIFKGFHGLMGYPDSITPALVWEGD